MSDGPVRVTHDGAVAVLTIDRPEKLNALDAETLAALETAVNEADRDPNVHVIVFTGTGRAFVAVILPTLKAGAASLTTLNSARPSTVFSAG